MLIPATLLFFCVVTSALIVPWQPIRRDITTLSTDDISALIPFTQFSRAAYCGIDALENWSCGEACDALPDFEPSLVGGDGGETQFFFVGYWVSQDSIVVSHQGTDPTEFESILTDLNLDKEPLNPVLFPGVSADVQVHEGFRDQHERTAISILDEVQRLMASTGTTTVITTGHSLGGALAALDALFFTLNLPEETTITSITYGTPRIGNQDFVELFDSLVPDYRRVNNRNDIVPILPGRFLGFAHTKGEIHLIGGGVAIACSGNDNEEDENCQIKTVPNLFKGNIFDHLGPYEGVGIGTIFCF